MTGPVSDDLGPRLVSPVPRLNNSFSFSCGKNRVSMSRHIG